MGSGRAKIKRILEWRIWSRWREINTQVFCEPGLVRECPSNQQHHFAVWCFGHQTTSYLFLSFSFVYFFWNFFGQGIAPANQRGVK